MEFLTWYFCSSRLLLEHHFSWHQSTQCARLPPWAKGRQGLILLIEDSTMIYAKMLDLKMS